MYKSRILLGLDEEEEGGVDVKASQDLKKLRQRNNENRTSLSQQFFQKKLGASSEHNVFRGVSI